MAKARALKDTAADPITPKTDVILKEIAPKRGIGHYALTMAIGLVAGVIGGVLSSRILKII